MAEKEPRLTWHVWERWLCVRGPLGLGSYPAKPAYFRKHKLGATNGCLPDDGFHYVCRIAFKYGRPSTSGGKGSLGGGAIQSSSSSSGNAPGVEIGCTFFGEAGRGVCSLEKQTAETIAWRSWTAGKGAGLRSI